MSKNNPKFENPALNSSVYSYALTEMAVDVTMDEVLGEDVVRKSIDEGKRRSIPRMIYKRRPLTVETMSNGDVQFTVNAPGVEKVEVSGRPGTAWGTERYEIGALDRGWFQGIVSGIPAGFQYMNFYFDGKEVLYSEAPIGYGYGKAVNYVDVPDPEDNTYLYKDVAHGSIRYETYPSNYTGKVRACWVYTPPSYDKDINKSYPVWYIQHGGGENETGWFWQGKINYIIDNLIAEGKCEEMIVVSNAGYAFSADCNEVEFLPGDFGKMLAEDCIPFIEERFRVNANKANRALSGLSMGSYQTLSTAYNYPDLVDYIGVFSGAVAPDMPGILESGPHMEDIETFNSQHKLLFYGRGMQEGGAKMLEEVEEWRKKGLMCETFTCEGVHEWQVWRKTAYVFAQKLFRA